LRYEIRKALDADRQQALALLPELSDFDVPAYRNPDHTWQGDAKMLEQYFQGQIPNTDALVAVDDQSRLHGISIYTMRPELLSGEPSAHLEVLVVAASSRREGIGQALIEATEVAAKARGAQSLTLHVFANNKRARSVYASTGFNEELLRCYKPL